MSFKLGSIVFELASNTTQNFVELWSSLIIAWCGKYLTLPGIPMLSTFSIIPCSNWSVITLSYFTNVSMLLLSLFLSCSDGLS